MEKTDKLRGPDSDDLFRAILSLRTLDECYAFFEDLCTVTELKAMSQRFHVVQLLDDKALYSDIVRDTGASTATISRVNRALAYGSDGYRLVLDRMKDEEEK